MSRIPHPALLLTRPHPLTIPFACRFIFKQQKLWLDWSLVLLIATAVLITYSTVLLVSLTDPPWAARRWICAGHGPGGACSIQACAAGDPARVQGARLLWEGWVLCPLRAEVWGRTQL